MITTVLCYSATSGSSVADCGKPCRVDMGNVGYNIRGFEFRAISGLGRIGGGGGLVSDFEHHHHVVHMGLGRASWQGAQGHCPPLRRPLCPSWRAGFEPTPTKSGASRASGLICGSWERRRPGPASAASRSPQKIVGVIVGAASRVGREHLQGSSPPHVHQRDRPEIEWPCRT